MVIWLVILMVNIRNMPETFEHDPEKWLENIFEAQRKLLSEYKVIERFDHLVDDDGKLKSMQALESQVLLKEFLLRIIARRTEKNTMFFTSMKK